MVSSLHDQQVINFMLTDGTNVTLSVNAGTSTVSPCFKATIFLSEVVYPVGQVRGLLDFCDEAAFADAMDASCWKEKHIAGCGIDEGGLVEHIHLIECGHDVGIHSKHYVLYYISRDYL